MHKITFSTKQFKTKEFTTSFIYLTDKDNQPCFGEISLHDDHITCSSTQKQFALNLLIEVEGIGKVVLRSAIESSRSYHVDLLHSLILGRISQIEKELLKCSKSTRKSHQVRLEKILLLPDSQMKLALLLQLGENITLKRAKKELSQKIKRNETKNFLIGGQAFGIDKGSKFRKIHKNNFEMGVAPFYFNFLMPSSPDKIDWNLTDRIVTFLEHSGKVIKGHPLVWFHIAAKPSWMNEMTCEEVKNFVKNHVPKIIHRYKDRIKMWDIINEVPSIDANSFDFTVEQLLDITKIVSEIVTELQPDAEKILNISDIFGPWSFVHDKPSIPPIHFLKLCKDKDIAYDSIGLQFYMGMRKEFACRELLNISQTFDEFCQFGKPIHLTELGWPSQHDVDPTSFFAADHPEVGGRWHRGWDEELQAEFAEAIFTIFASKSLAKSITWWDLTDNGIHTDIGSRFIPFGGLTRRNFSPKPILKTIQTFRKKIHRKV